MAALNQHIQNVYLTVEKGLTALSAKRKKLLIFQRIMWMITGVFIVFILLFFAQYYLPNQKNIVFDWMRKIVNIQNDPYANLYPFGILFVLIYPSVYLFSSRFRKFNILEAKIYAQMLKSLFPRYEFTQNTHLSLSKIKESKLFSWVKHETPIATYGQIRLTENNVQVNIADIGIIEANVRNKLVSLLLSIPGLNMLVILYEYILKNISTSKTTNYYTFRGMYCWVKFNKKMNGQTVIISNSIKSKANRWASFNFKAEEKISLEDARFTKHFEVYGSDQIEARYILTPILMEKIVALREKYNRNIMLSFTKSQLFLTVDNPHGLFSFPSKRINSITLIEELVAQIDTTVGVVNDFNLNNKLTNE